MNGLKWKLWSKEPPVETGVYWLMEFHPVCYSKSDLDDGEVYDCRKPKLTQTMKEDGFKNKYCMFGKFASCLDQNLDAPFIWELNPIPALHKVQGIAGFPADQMFWYGPITPPQNPEGKEYDDSVLWKGEQGILYKPVLDAGEIYFEPTKAAS